MSALGTGETTRDGQLIPESEVERLGPEIMSFEAQAAETVKSGRGRQVPSGAGQTFQARAAETVTLQPPHWQKLPEVPAEPAAPAVIETQGPLDGPSESQPEPPGHPGEAEGEPAPAPEASQPDHGPEAVATEKES
ncbi:MAG: hypothetical protein NTY36_01250 [Deltaproteobacteria bacterium]|nr:hypothetical protein [Deltaproteobacteria bacterium]